MELQEMKTFSDILLKINELGLFRVKYPEMTYELTWDIIKTINPINILDMFRLYRPVWYFRFDRALSSFVDWDKRDGYIIIRSCIPRNQYTFVLIFMYLVCNWSSDVLAEEKFKFVVEFEIMDDLSKIIPKHFKSELLKEMETFIKFKNFHNFEKYAKLIGIYTSI